VGARILELKASGDGILKIGPKLGIGTSRGAADFQARPVAAKIAMGRSSNTCGLDGS
jgi:hypothetical protein